MRRSGSDHGTGHPRGLIGARRRVAALALTALFASALSGCLGAAADAGPAITAQPTSAQPPSAEATSPTRSSTSPSSARLATSTEPSAAPTTADLTTTDTALAAGLLDTLPVKGRAPRTGYSRSQFGQPWADVDRNGCDTRNDVLRRDLTGLVLKPGTNGCKVVGGVLPDPYSGAEVALADIQVDHVVALSDAWQKGAQQLDATQRLALANDPLNLQPTLGSVNQQKSDSDAASWLPPVRGYRCSYVARQVAVKARYGLWVTPAEHDAIAAVLSGCPGQTVPESAALPSATATPSATPPVEISPSATTGSAAPLVGSTPATGQCDPAYPGVCIPPVSVAGDLDCSQISERRFTVLSPDPHNFDGNHDGVGCESD